MQKQSTKAEAACYVFRAMTPSLCQRVHHVDPVVNGSIQVTLRLRSWRTCVIFISFGAPGMLNCIISVDQWGSGASFGLILNLAGYVQCNHVYKQSKNTWKLRLRLRKVFLFLTPTEIPAFQFKWLGRRSLSSFDLGSNAYVSEKQQIHI